VAIDITRYRNRAVTIPFGERVADARNDQGMTQEALGYRIGLSQSIVSRQERGKLSFSPQDAANLAMALHNRRLLDHYCELCPAAAAYRKLAKPRPA